MYHPKEFWEKRLSKNFSLMGVGCTGFSNNYNKWMYKAFKKSIDSILKENLKDKKILDIGCGTGFYIEHLLNKGATDISGMDIAKKSILALKKKYPSLTFLNADISEKISLKKKYDLILAMSVLYHIVDGNKFEKAIKNIRKLAKKGSQVVILDMFLKKYQPPKKGTHCYFRAYNQYKEVLEKNGINIIKTTPTLYFLNPPFDINNKLIRRIFLLLWNVTMSIFAKNEFTGYIIGAILYLLDRIMANIVKDSVALETMTCRVIE